MPVKKKKGKAKAKKGKGKGKGKGKKGSKSVKVDKESVVKEAVANAKIWEHKYHAIDKSRLEYRDNAKKLVSENETLQKAVNQTERDTIEVIAYLKKEDAEKEVELDQLRQQVKELRVDASRERDTLTEEYSQKIEKLDEGLHEKEEEVKIIQGELKAVKEFRKRKGEMQEKLEQLQTSLEESEEEHKKTMSILEQKFFEEKLRLQKEANRRIAKLAENAHDQAVSNLDERTREVYRENIRLSEALTLHIDHEEKLQKSQAQLEMTNRQLVAEKELNQELVKEKIKQSTKHKRQIKQLQDKVLQLEQSLTVLVQEFQQEKKLQELSHSSSQALVKAELQGLQRRCQLQDKETSHVKRLARRILDQRTEMEVFFLDALAHVRKEIEANRAEYREYAQLMYQQKMLAASKGRGRYPFITTFKPGQDASTNSVYHDMEHAQSWEHVGGDGERVDISDMTWEQKEQVLRLLFAKMNGTTSSTSRHCPSLPPLTSPFSSSPNPVLPSIAEGPPSSTHSPKSQTRHPPVFMTQPSGQGAERTIQAILTPPVP